MSRSTIAPARISRVLPDSIAAELGFEVGDRLVSVNGQELRDLIDYQFAIADEYLELEVLDAKGDRHRVELEKDWDDDLGLEFETALFDGLIQCNNACPFCFIDQQPPEMRATLHLKDDDYRLSFLYGSYLTLTNLPQPEWERIARLRLSPLYVSVHATEPDLRARLLKNPRAAQILEQLEWFRQQQLQIHAQVVLCPGWNDGEHLTRTLLDLASFHRAIPAERVEAINKFSADEFSADVPTVLSAAVVPVGLTRFRPSEDEISPVSRDRAIAVIARVEALQAQFRAELGTTFAWLADEWYLIAGRDLPPPEHYEDYPQIGNGVGSIRQFLQDFESAAAQLPDRLPQPLQVTWVVGNSVERVFEPIAARFNQVENLDFRMLAIASQFWGQELTVTGLLTGGDILSALRDIPGGCGDVLLLPSVTLKNSQTFLDDLALEDLAQQLQVEIVTVGGGVRDLADAISNLRTGLPAGAIVRSSK
ncbi:TIGR03279 family radical SAM protein [Synechococcus sp. PCC 7336]|uniref:TIGR03279 family radical SAM protein n=1 Tax=Synechococcus sp. PCC 7336 TaxID=195250 RepID=UPI000345705A|nr:TIGR03279 family radical SAM protein [Synechococcus sp. PCC 7336]